MTQPQQRPTTAPAVGGVNQAPITTRRVPATLEYGQARRSVTVGDYFREVRRVLQVAEHAFRVAAMTLRISAGRFDGLATALLPVAQHTYGNLITDHELLLRRLARAQRLHLRHPRMRCGSAAAGGGASGSHVAPAWNVGGAVGATARLATLVGAVRVDPHNSASRCILAKVGVLAHASWACARWIPMRVFRSV